ncbi:hypothetical protein EV426DRAFT_603130 [Tirmania nivea]|nr:hypothetical protein EV426DRAFT_603130 [Tirmania nivea]
MSLRVVSLLLTCGGTLYAELRIVYIRVCDYCISMCLWLQWLSDEDFPVLTVPFICQSRFICKYSTHSVCGNFHNDVFIIM